MLGQDFFSSTKERLMENELCGICSSEKPAGFHFTQKIGSTIYKVSTYFSKRSTETTDDKIERLIQQDCTLNS